MYIYLYSHNPKYNGIEKSLRANQMSYIEEEQITQWPIEKVQNDDLQDIYIKLKKYTNYIYKSKMYKKSDRGAL